MQNNNQQTTQRNKRDTYNPQQKVKMNQQLQQNKNENGPVRTGTLVPDKLCLYCQERGHGYQNCELLKLGPRLDPLQPELAIYNGKGRPLQHRFCTNCDKGTSNRSGHYANHCPIFQYVPIKSQRLNN